MKIRPVGAEVIQGEKRQTDEQTDEQTDRHDEATSRFFKILRKSV